MGVFNDFDIVKMVPNSAKHLICEKLYQNELSVITARYSKVI